MVRREGRQEQRVDVGTELACSNGVIHLVPISICRGESQEAAAVKRVPLRQSLA